MNAVDNAEADAIVLIGVVQAVVFDEAIVNDTSAYAKVLVCVVPAVVYNDAVVNDSVLVRVAQQTQKSLLAL